MKKKVFYRSIGRLLVLCGLLAFLCTGCGSMAGARVQQDTPKESPREMERIGLILTSRDAQENESVTELLAEAADSLGAELTVCTPDVSAAEAAQAYAVDLSEVQSCDVNPIEYQMLAVNELVAADVDVIVIHANHASGLESTLSAARAVGITVIAYEFPVTEACCDIYVERASDIPEALSSL